MKGDFTRLTFDARKGYTAVLSQQGRVQLDSDANEATEITSHLEDTRFIDVVGTSGVPGGLGFQVHIDSEDELRLTGGRIYAGSLICDLNTETPVSDLTRKPLNPAPGRTDLIFLDAWERLVTAIDDPNLLDPALGGVDTATRLHVEYAIDTVEDVGALPLSEAANALPQPRERLMSASAPDGSVGLENHLYRVEIHDPGSLDEATFKWSRNNGSVVFSIERLVPPDAAVLAPAISRSHEIAPGDWLEISDQKRERLGRLGMLARVQSWAEDSRKVTFDRDVSALTDEMCPRARRWDQTDGPTMPVGENWLELESGIEVSFAGSDFRTGDYWTFPTRIGLHQVELLSEEPPQGIQHRLCPLALVTWDSSETPKPSECRDCRRPFVPLTELYGEILRLRAEVADLDERLKRS
jgi:hypothetical protein